VVVATKDHPAVVVVAVAAVAEIHLLPFVVFPAPPRCGAVVAAVVGAVSPCCPHSKLSYWFAQYYHPEVEVVWGHQIAAAVAADTSTDAGKADAGRRLVGVDHRVVAAAAAGVGRRLEAAIFRLFRHHPFDHQRFPQRQCGIQRLSSMLHTLVSPQKLENMIAGSALFSITAAACWAWKA